MVHVYLGVTLVDEWYTSTWGSGSAQRYLPSSCLWVLRGVLVLDLEGLQSEVQETYGVTW